MNVKSESRPTTTDKPLSLHIPMWPLYLIYVLCVAYLALWLLMFVASCSNSQTGSAVPAPTEGAIETSLIAPDPDEGRAP